MSKIKKLPVFTSHSVTTDGPACGHQHKTAEGALNCARNRAIQTRHNHHVCERKEQGRRYTGSSIIVELVGNVWHMYEETPSGGMLPTRTKP